MKNPKVDAVTSFLTAMTGLVKAKYGDAGAVANAEKAVTALQNADDDYLDADFEQACNEFATAATLRVSIAGPKPSDDPSKIVKRPQPSTPLGSTASQPGSSATGQVGSHVTGSHPVTGAQPGDVTAKKSGLV
jgi:hypothetical protein